MDEQDTLKNTAREEWTVEQSASFPGLYIAYDEEGNSITGPTRKDRAYLVAAAPVMREALGRIYDIADSLERIVAETPLPGPHRNAAPTPTR